MHGTNLQGVAEPFEMLVVCTANVCRSPLAERVIGVKFADAASHGAIHEHVLLLRSAGTDAEPGDPMCAQSAAHVHFVPQGHRARLIKPRLLATAGLVVTADRGHRGECARMWPECRPRLFTLNQAAALAGQVAATLANGELPEGAPTLPRSEGDRLRWLVGEMDAARGSMAGMPEGYEDIIDEHGSVDHSLTLLQVVTAASTLGQSMIDVLTATVPRPSTTPSPP